jgi:NAD(P)-dependent dehydrogenase (short-subunit alcohol dehydrogenase family)
MRFLSKLIAILTLLSLVFFNSLVQAEKQTATNSGQKAVLVTGASSGIGLNLAKKLAAQGYFVYAGARKDKDLKALSALKNIQGVKLDVTVQSDIDAAVEYVKKQGRGLYGLVNNAGVGVFAPLIEMSEADMQFQMNVNLFGPYRVTKAFAPLIIKSKGRISTIGSIAGSSTSAFFGAYSMSKFSIEAFTDSLAQEMSKFGVKVSVVEPGNYNSRIAESFIKREQKNKKNNFKSLYEEDIKRLYTGYLKEGDRSNFKEPDDVSLAVIDALFSEKPKARYLVVPVQGEAEWAIRSLLKRVSQMNQGQPFSYDRAALIKMLDEELMKSAQ